MKELEAGTPAAGVAGPRNVAEARQVVESTRERISATLDQLETRIVDKKEELRDRLDVVRPVREFVGAKPLLAIAAAAGAGLLFGLLTGGGESSEIRDETQLSEHDRETVRRWRAERRKRLLETADEELPYFEPPPSRVGRFFRDLTHELAGAGTALLVAQLAERVRDAQD